jgi:hypothetical protein
VIPTEKVQPVLSVLGVALSWIVRGAAYLFAFSVAQGARFAPYPFLENLLEVREIGPTNPEADLGD